MTTTVTSPTSMTMTNSSLEIGLGSFCTLGLETLELLAQPPMNFVLMDAQHGSWSLEQLKHGIRAAEAMGVQPMIRLPVAGQWMIEALLDAGCNSILFPMINTPLQAEEASRACYYPPLGLRSQSTCRANLRHGSNYRKLFNGMFKLRVMIEHVDAVKSIDAILDVPGITGCIIGPSDLASSMTAINDNVPIETHISHVLAACTAKGKSVGIACATMADAHQRKSQGFDQLIVSTDRKMLLNSVAELDSQWKQNA